MPVSIALIRKLEEVEPRLREVLFAILEEIERQREETVTKKEFNELKEIVKELAEAQKQTEVKLTRVEKAVEELAQAQRQTEVRLTRVEKAVEELAQAQRQTEVRLTRVEKAVEELAQAQKRTEQELQKLIKEHTKTREQAGGLSITVGYILENEAMKALPTLLLKEFGLKVEDRLVRKFIKDKRGRPIEINIIGKAIRDGERVVIIGEAKTQLSKNKVLEFLRKKIKPLEGVFKEESFPILVTHMITQPDVEEYAYKNGIKRLYYSYEF